MLKIGLIGCGAIGTIVAKAIERGDAGSVSLSIVFDIKREKAVELANRLKKIPTIAKNFEELLKSDADIIIEAASQEAVREYGEKVLKKKNIIIMSVGALLSNKLLRKLDEIGKKYKNRIWIPSGAICGIDGIKAGSIGKIEEVCLTTTKPPKSLGLKLRKKMVVFDGFAEKAVKLFPQNINVAATLSLAGIGKEKTRVRIIADPFVDKNIHEIYIKGEFGEIHTKTENFPCPTNPKTSYIAALSVIRLLKDISASIRIGT